VNRSWQKVFKAFTVLILVAAIQGCITGEAQEAARAGIRKVLDAQVEAWNRRDLEGYMAGYWQSPDLSFYSNSSVTLGWEPTLNRYRARYQGEGREMGRLSFNDLQIEMLGPESAFVRGRFQLVMSKETSSGIFTLIVKKFPAGWRIVHDHTSA
jgi:ketosteroid isomerase-like protein